ncbi:MAG: hypothetical protein AABY53_02070 [Bdellovibrionota bacterium]
MKFLICLPFLILSSRASASENQIGVIIGSITGLSAKHNLGNNRAIDGALSYSINSRYGFSVHADYLVTNARIFNLGQIGPMNLYYGIGFRVQNIRTGVDSGNSRVSVRAPIGVFHQISNPDLEFFGEIAPALDITPSTDVSFEVGLGVRYRF